ncbi:SpoIIE family protein phosphatase [Streptacidiphilus sp. ASG 303]|uniref:SpoIIE family protein phosphatase n=1 Tax=Streptacidiphilus sp. ASG 303 TaxID=2896847 RepID=UPI001E5A8617|nr:SpoIIE family protein phosphatase [Streptacidiphilus sp. ASG 303]MCD0483246.1 SpoIIE family protein phosphatase [Streptacidiphilus sp. ASG 303]
MADVLGGTARLTVDTYDRFLAGEPLTTYVRPPILDSWRRCRSLGLLPDWPEIPFRGDPAAAERLLRAAAPVLDRFESTIADSRVAVALTDADATVLHRRAGDPSLRAVLDDLLVVPGFSYAESDVGTNACGTALVERRPCLVLGAEHFAERLRPYACAAAPIRDPVSGRIEGAVDITCRQDDANPQMEALVRRIAADIEGRLLARYREREQALLRAYARAGSRVRPADPGPATLLTPDAAVGSGDLVRLREQATRLISAPGRGAVEVPLTGGGAAVLHSRPVSGPGGIAGVAVEASVSPTPAAGTGPAVADGGANSSANGSGGHGGTPGTGSAATGSAATDGTGTDDTGTGGAAGRWLLLVGEPGVGSLAVAARRRLDLLYEAGVRIGTTLDLRRTAEELARVAVPGLADHVTVDLPDCVLEGEEPGPAGPDAELRRTAAVGLAGDCPFYAVGELVRFIPDSPQARAYTGRRAVLEPRLAESSGWTAQRPEESGRILGFGVHSLMSVPLRARGVVLGVASFYRLRRPEPFEDDDLSLAEEFVARAAVCIDNARRYTREHATALALQHSLLPHRLPGHNAVEVAHSYLPSHAAVGGDWFDTIPLSGGRVALVVGDVVGHGLHAAATMGRLRTAVHNFSALDLPPDELLTHLDDLVGRLDEEAGGGDGGGGGDGVIGATCLYAVYDPVARRCTLARAGHPLPALVAPDGTVDFPELPAGPPLGLGGMPFETAELDLPEGSRLVLYTDGLLQGGAHDPVLGLERLRGALRHAGPTARQTRDAVLDALPATDPHDDVALLVARTRAFGPAQVAEWEVPAAPAAVSAMRATALRQLTAWGLDDLAFTTELVLSELVTNAIRHATGPIRLRLLRDRALVCEVADGSSTSPRLRRADSGDEGGRGLFLVARLTQRWGTRYTPRGKVIWTEQPLPDGPLPAPAAA